MVELIVLGSGSRGNATLIRCNNRALLVDAGFSARQLVHRLEAVGQDPRRLEAIVLTHEHGDHVGGVRVLTKRFQTTVFANEATYAQAGADLDTHGPREMFVTGESFDIGPFRVRSFAVPHDAVEPVGFVIEAEGQRVGYATDLGHVTKLVSTRLGDCAALVFEANHDRGMLMEGPYPWETKQRIASRFGHLSNEHAASELCEIITDSTRHVVAAHLSENNNDPLLARAVIEGTLRSAGHRRVNVAIAHQHRPLEAIRL
ncbi:MAG: MBL fold metallo-hydrolase [Acidobacteriota bacterium]|nr:MAG: MBL fold metallo-hydrolase [Acidobacteriota bacterium]